MATQLGVRAERLKSVAALQSGKDRRECKRFAFEGPTLLREAIASSFPIQEIYATQAAYDETALVRELDAGGTPTFLIEPSSARQISDLATPSGIVVVASVRFAPLEEIFGQRAHVVVLADVGDPANAGTLLRSADAFGAAGVVCGSLGVDPFHPKVVRGSMGAIFRVRLAVAEPNGVAEAAAGAGLPLLGLRAGGEPLESQRWQHPAALVVGHERHGLGRWEGCCARLLGIGMAGPAESLSAAVAGSIALYEATRHGPGR